MDPARDPKIFHFVMIKPLHYDDDGYVIQWAKSLTPSNTQASMAKEKRKRAARVAGPRKTAPAGSY